MNEPLVDKLRALRNEVAGGHRSFDLGHLAERLRELGTSVSPSDLQWFVTDLLRGFSGTGGFYVPPVLVSVVRSLVEGRSAHVACDPWAGLGVLAAIVQEAVQPRKTIACAPNAETVALARVLTPQLDWHTGDPFAFLETLTDPLDVISSVLPFGLRASQAVELRGESGEPVRCTGDLGSLLLAAASSRLSLEGLGLFVVTPSFFFTQRSVLRDLPRLGLGVEAALALPAGSFAPFTNIPTYLVVVRKRASAQMFVAQLSKETHTNRPTLEDLRMRIDERQESLGDTVAAGRQPELVFEAERAVANYWFVAPEGFRGVERLQLAGQLRKEEHLFQGPGVRLGELAEAIHLGRRGDDFAFPKADNAVYIPLVGMSDVVDSAEAMTLKQHNYAQVVVDAARSDTRFVAQFLNSELGRSIREANKSGTAIRKLNTTGLRELTVFVPDLETQKGILEIAARLAAEQNILLGLQNDLRTLQRGLWTGPETADEVDERLRAFSGRLAADAAPQAAEALNQWFETLPFPLASILRAWQATASQDYKTKHEHLLHFFEATATFLSVVYLSAFSSQRAFYADHKERLAEALKKQGLSLQRPTLGTWKVIVEYFSKQTRGLLSGDTEKQALCAELFSDPTQVLPEMLARKELAAVLSATIEMRNRAAHGGVIGQAEAQLRNEQLITELQRMRDAMADAWRRVPARL